MFSAFVPFTLWLLFVPCPTQTEAAPAQDSAERVDQILNNLQARSDGLRDIRCDVRFVDDDRVNLAKNVKNGRLLFLMTKPNPHFLIHFDSTEMDGVLGKREWYLFDGEWLYQAVERTTQVTKQQIAEPGSELDMFDLEKTPFPMPFGQKRDSILRNFDVKLVDSAGDDPSETDHLMCVPKPDSRLYRKYDRLDLFVHRTAHLPARIVVTKNNGYEVQTADFPGLSGKSLNTGVSESDLAKPTEWNGYKVVVEELVAPSAK